MLDVILQSNGPREAKAAGRKVRGFDNELWQQHRFEIVVKGNVEKFTQHEDMQTFLLDTAKPTSNADLNVPYRAVAEEKSKYDIESTEEDADEVRERLSIYDVGQEQADESSVDSETDRLATKTVLVEAAGRDTIWGIGLGKSNPKSRDPFQWRGLNLLGFALTDVREKLRENQ